MQRLSIWSIHRSRSHNIGGVWRSLVSAPVLGTGGREFESLHPDQLKAVSVNENFMPLPLKPFYLIRHGQSVANSQKLMSGCGVDTPLSDVGISQAQNAGNIMSKVLPKPSVVIHSDLLRTKNTSQEVNKGLLLPVHAEFELREHALGDWENRPYEECVDTWKAGTNPPNGETHEEFFARIKLALNKVLNKFDMPLIVAHGGVFRAIGGLYGNPINNIENARPYLFEPIHTGEKFPWTLTTYDDSAQKINGLSSSNNKYLR